MKLITIDYIRRKLFVIGSVVSRDSRPITIAFFYIHVFTESKKCAAESIFTTPVSDDS